MATIGSPAQTETRKRKSFKARGGRKFGYTFCSAQRGDPRNVPDSLGIKVRVLDRVAAADIQMLGGEIGWSG